MTPDPPPIPTFDHIARAWKLYELQRYPACIDAARQHLGVVPNDSEAYRLIAHAAAEGGQPQQALAAAQQAVAIAPSHASAYLALAVANHIAGNRDAADTAIGEALRLDPQDAKSHEQLARQTMVRQRWRELAKVAREGLTHDPCNEYLHFARALATSQIDLRHVAFQQIEEGLSLNPENVNLLTLKGALLVEKGDTRAGLPHLLDALRITPDSEYARTQLGRARYWIWYFLLDKMALSLTVFVICFILWAMLMAFIYVANGFAWP